MPNCSRRRFIYGFGSVSGAALIASAGRAETFDMSDPVALVIALRGPLALVNDGDYVRIYGAPANNHIPVLATAGASRVFQDGIDYELSGLPASGSPKAPNGPIFMPTFNDQLTDVDTACRFKIRLKRPDFIEGIDSAPMTIPGQKAPKFATGMLLVYRAVERKQSIALTSSSMGSYALDFTPEDEASLPVHNVICRLAPPHVYDQGHQDAIASFGRLASMLPKTITDPGIVYPDSKLSYAQQEAAVLKKLEQPAQKERTPRGRLSRSELDVLQSMFSGPGSDCQVPTVALGF